MLEVKDFILSLIHSKFLDFFFKKRKRKKKENKKASDIIYKKMCV